MSRYIKDTDVYRLVEPSGVARVHCSQIDELPRADVVEVRHGEWKLHPDGSGTCSCCNRTQKSVWDYDNAQNFCGHCGAKMEGERREKCTEQTI